MEFHALSDHQIILPIYFVIPEGLTVGINKVDLTNYFIEREISNDDVIRVKK